MHDESSSTTPYVKAVTRDIRQYLRERNLRTVPVGYSAADIDSNRLKMAQYMNCGTDDKHEWQEVSALHSKMTIVYSGGLVYEYSQEGSNYGLVKINSDDLKEPSDIDALKSAFEKTTNPEGVAMGFDDGAVVVKMGREEPAVLMDGSGKIVWAKHNEVASAVIKSGDASVKDGAPLALPMKTLESCEVYPQTLSHCAEGSQRSVFGRSGLEKSIIGTPGTVSRPQIFKDPAECNEGLSVHAPDFRFLQEKKGYYADQAQLLNSTCLQVQTFPILYEFSAIEQHASRDGEASNAPTLLSSPGAKCQLKLRSRRNYTIFNSCTCIVLIVSSLVVCVFGTSQWQWEPTSYKTFCLARAPHPGDCHEICEAMEIDLNANLQPFSDTKWEHGLCEFGVANLQHFPVQIPLREIAELCSKILLSVVSDTWCEVFIETRYPTRLGLAMTANEEDLPRYSSNYTPSFDSPPLPTLSPRNIALGLIWAGSLIVL